MEWSIEWETTIPSFEVSDKRNRLWFYSRKQWKILDIARVRQQNSEPIHAKPLVNKLVYPIPQSVAAHNQANYRNTTPGILYCCHDLYFDPLGVQILENEAFRLCPDVLQSSPATKTSLVSLTTAWRLE